MPQETTYYQLKKPLETETYNVDVFNDNFDAIDNQMHVNAEAIKTKQNTITGSATTITSATLTKDRVVITNSSGKIAVSDITSTELGYLDGVTSNLQTQINSVASSVTSEANTRASADTTLQGKIDAEASARSSADTTLQANIDKKVGKSGNETIEGTKTFTTIPVVTLSTSSTATGKQLTTADWVIGKVNASATTLEGKITTEATARASGDSALQGKIDAEATARSTADSTLQTNIDNGLATKVSKSGDTMTGNLTIQNASTREFTLKNTSISKNYEKWKQVGIINGNASDGTIGQIEFLRNTPGGHLGSSIQLTSYNATGGAKYLVLYSFDDGVSQEAYVQHPSWKVGTNDNSDKSLTIKMANSLPSLVHTTGAETIAGAKTFTTPIIDPQNQSGYIQTPNSSASSTPYYCVASRSISSMNTYDRSSLTFDIVAERYGDSIVYGTLQAMFETDSNKNIIASAIAMIYKSSTSSVASNVDNWFLTYNATQDLIQVWCKLTSNQYVIRTRNRFNGSRYSNYTSWKLLDTTTGQASAPSSADGWVTVNCVDMSNKLATSTPSTATSNEIATADWSIGKFQSKVTISTSTPSGGNDGDLWAVYS